jgi:hypothetical protein
MSDVRLFDAYGNSVPRGSQPSRGWSVARPLALRSSYPGESSTRQRSLRPVWCPVHAVRQSTAAAAPRPAARSGASPAARSVAEPSAADRQAFRAGVEQERRRWASVLGSRAFTLEPAIAAHLLAWSNHPAGEIIKMIRQISADSAAAPREQAAAIADRWSAAFQRMEAAAASADGLGRRRVTDPARFNKLMDTGCYPAVAGLRFTRIEHGEEISLFRMVLSPADKRMGEMPALWYGNSDMRVDGANT